MISATNKILRRESCLAVKPAHVPAFQNSREGLVRVVQDTSCSLNLYLPCAACFLSHLAEKQLFSVAAVGIPEMVL